MHEIAHIINGNTKPRYLDEFYADKFALDKFNEMGLDTTQFLKRMKWHVLSRVAMSTNRGHKNVSQIIKDFYPNIKFEKWYGKRVFVHVDTPKGVGMKNPKYWDYIKIDINKK